MYFEDAKIAQKDGKDATGYQTNDESDSKPIIVQPITGTHYWLIVKCYCLFNLYIIVGMEEKIYWEDEQRRDTKKKK